MNKRNTIILTIVLVVLVLTLVERGFLHHHFSKPITIDFKEQVVSKKEMKPSVCVDSSAIKECNYPIVIHYQKPKQFGDAYAMNHIIGLSMNILDSCPPMPDSTEAIHVYTKSIRSKTKYIYLGLYSKTSINEDVEYRVTYPVNDRSGLRVVTDSGLVCTAMHWKFYGPSAPGKFKEQAEEKMTKQVEDDLVRDIIKKMKRNEEFE